MPIPVVLIRTVAAVFIVLCTSYYVVEFFSTVYQCSCIVATFVWKKAKIHLVLFFFSCLIGLVIWFILDAVSLPSLDGLIGSSWYISSIASPLLNGTLGRYVFWNESGLFINDS